MPVAARPTAPSQSSAGSKTNTTANDTSSPGTQAPDSVATLIVKWDNKSASYKLGGFSVHETLAIGRTRTSTSVKASLSSHASPSDATMLLQFPSGITAQETVIGLDDGESAGISYNDERMVVVVIGTDDREVVSYFDLSTKGSPSQAEEGD